MGNDGAAATALDVELVQDGAGLADDYTSTMGKLRGSDSLELASKVVDALSNSWLWIAIGIATLWKLS